ncbi:apoptotic protease-activating factor 1-like [Schistocerca nitens]|uniref:apoptotic protease-activating factor 1-like n=1 Tax=Schistocerca nitens TaxID=7011 RepID=UPI002119A9B4|nr:apoptotic protease-activating factor 1-like [Schistocerca nitens]
MDTIKRLKLQNLRDEIVQDLDVDDIVDGLLSSAVITEEERESIFSEKTRKARVRHLLDLLPSKGSCAFDNFVRNLKSEYQWLYSKLIEDTDPSQDEEKFLDALLLGGIPRTPPHNVERQETLLELRASLKSLTRGNYIVLHGMTGSGKSCLAAAAVENLPLVTKSFKNCVFWLSVGDSGSNVLSHVNHLLWKLQATGRLFPDEFQRQELMNLTWFRETLKRYYTDKDLREGLLILDDVASSDVIDAFDIGCKILVTTKDLEVMRKVRGRISKTIKLNDGFKEIETLSLFAKCINQTIEDLPHEARQIHRLCKGIPMLVALIGANLEEHSEDARSNKGRWNNFITMLKSKHYSSPGRSTFYQDELLSAVGMSVGNLPEYQKERFQDFALFKEDVNIKPEVLQVLWSLNKYEVEDIMSYFVKKSLAVSKWNEELNSSVYGIHDIILDYLKFGLTKEKKRELHRKLLEAYSKICDGDFSKLPNDNYIYTYFGYHIDEAEMWDLYSNLFISLPFVQAKLKVTGPGDLLLDYRKYRSNIDKEQEDLKAVVDDFERFVHSHGLDLYKYQDLDAVQCALKEPRQSFVFNEAYKIAKECNTRLYLEHILNQDFSSDTQSLPVEGGAVTACFTHSENKIIVGCYDGSINLLAVDYKHILHSFQGHKNQITYVQCHSSNKIFLSSSEDGTVKLWSLEDIIDKKTEKQKSGDSGTVRTPSPRLRQTSWSNMFSESGSDDKSIFTFSKHKGAVSCASFAHKKNEVVSCSVDGCVKVWDSETGAEKLHIDVPNNSKPNSCTFSNDDTLLYFGGEDSHLYVYSAEFGTFLSGLGNDGPIVTILGIPDSEYEVIVVTEDSIICWSWEGVNTTPPENVITSGEITATLSLEDLEKQVLGRSKGTTFVCATITEDSEFVITASSNHSVCIWDINPNASYIVKEYHDQSGDIYCLSSISVDSSIHRFLSCTNKNVRLWKFDPSASGNNVTLLSTFDALWQSDDLNFTLPLFAVADNTNKVQVLRGKELICESSKEETQITCCKFVTTNCVVYGCADGMVKLFEVEPNKVLHIVKLNKPVVYLDVFKSVKEITITAGDQTELKMWHLSGEVLPCYGIKDLVVKCFLLSDTRKMLSCSKDGSVKVSRIDTGELEEVIVGQIRDATITGADFCPHQEILAMADKNNCFHIIWLTNSERELYSETKRVSSPPHCCCFSPCGQLIALGQENGSIYIWNVTKNSIHCELNHHRSRVKDITFAQGVPDGALLVSVAETVAWWSAAQAHKCRPNRGRRRQSQPPFNLSLLPVEPTLADVWMTKIPHTGNCYLLGCLKLAGADAGQIVCSPDFSQFATVDSAGFIYLLGVIN